MKNSLKGFLPSIDQVALVYSLVVLLVYSWTILLFLYDLPRWILFLSPLEVLVVFAYSMVFAFIDSIIFLVALVIPSVLFFKSFLKDKFESVVGAITISSYSWIVFLRYKYQFAIVGNLGWMDERFPLWLVLSISSTILIGMVVYRSTYVQKIVYFVSDKVQVFLYIYLPLSIICMVIIAIRTLI